MGESNIGILLNRLLPLKFKGKVLDYVHYSDVDWYISNSREKYYNEFLDFDFSKDVSEKDWKSRVNYLINRWKLVPNKETEIRLLLKDDVSQEIYGGCTIFDNRSKDGSVIIAYFIVPKHQNKGIGYELINKVLEILKSLNINKVKITIQETNEASINLAIKTGFKEDKRIRGKKVNNIVMYKLLSN